jgi:copper chaperone CopZ
MRKFTLLVVALAVSVGAASAMACDNDKASTASASKSSSGSCCSSSSNATASATKSGECPYSKDATASGSCSAHKNANATAGMPADCKSGDCADAVFQIASIHGDCCVDGVASALKTVKGVQYVNVDVKTKKAYVCTRGAKLDQKAALKSLKDAGFANAVYVGMDKKHMMKEATKTTAKPSNATKV